ncbi:TonB-dependent receptor domain-containing protein [Marinimicrobium sp. ARAG 43.8]|uniref:TonB-dependent receptor domain-containing protein n=1 Tax=Marinimicrobium sp. ARAG 43.8 TaxID=3418719 RepID=UPI003CFABCDB
MNSKYFSHRSALAGFSVSLLSVLVSASVQAQDNDESEPPVVAPPVMEELLVTGGRLMSGAESLAVERQEAAVATDLLGADQISRIGDSTVALALTRVPGVTLVDDKFVFVRGLGERYSSTTLNGAMVPSPDLSRNVLPLDIIPTSIVDSLAIQKVPSADKPAAFGGGSVDIRTTGIPDELLFSLELGTGTNTASSDFLTYSGGGDDRWGSDDGTRALSAELNGALDNYRGNLNAANMHRLGDFASLSDARAANRELASTLNRDISPRETSGDPDIKAEINLGNNFELSNGMELGFLAGAAYDSGWRNRDVIQRAFLNPQEQVTFEDETIYSVDITGNLSFGLRLNSENTIETTSLWLRNTDDEVSVRNYFNANRFLSDGRGFRATELRYEEREMEVHQIHGEHELGWETLDTLGLEDTLGFLRGLTFNWYISESEATTDLPNEVNALGSTTTDPNTGEVLSSSFDGANSRAVSYRFSDLQDNVDSNGFSVTMPITTDSWDIKLTGGMDYWQKSRAYRQYEFYLGSTSLGNSDPLFTQELSDILANENILNPDNGFQVTNSQDNANSYIAANKVNAAFGQLDVTWDYTWRLVVGSRWEDYQQVNLPWEPVKYDGSQFPGMDSTNPEVIADYFQNVTYADDEVFNSVALTWMLQDFWAEDFQLRASFGETTVRPDLREISSASYFDPITDIVVNGNPNVVPSQIDNYDLRAEWFFSGGDNFTLSLFYKDIVNPIEMFEGAATDDNIRAEIHNGDSAELYGLEVEFLKQLGSLSPMLDPFFVQGNFTFMDQELVAGNNADAPTNPVRPMQGASDVVSNLILGFDSPDSMHSATLSYNSFSERLFFAGRNGAPDSYEQPFHSLDFTYSFYPDDHFTVKFKVKNLLDENLTLERTNTRSDGSSQDIEVYHQERGQELSLSVQYRF